jgi:hypothetical protein
MSRWMRFSVQVLLVALAVAVWGYDLHLVVRPSPQVPEADSAILIRRGSFPPVAYPWQSARLPTIPWRMEAPAPVSADGADSPSAPVPDLELVGIFHAEGREAALLRNRASGETFLLRSRESIHGVTLVSAVRDGVTLNSGSRSWRLALASRREYER